MSSYTISHWLKVNSTCTYSSVVQSSDVTCVKGKTNNCECWPHLNIEGGTTWGTRRTPPTATLLLPETSHHTFGIHLDQSCFLFSSSCHLSSAPYLQSSSFSCSWEEFAWQGSSEVETVSSMLFVA